ncbi:glycosyltransferase family 4 protein [Pseudomonas aeruginosa]
MPASPKERRHAHRTRLPHRRHLTALGHQPPGLCHGAGPGKPARHAGDPLHRGPSRRPAAPAGGLPAVGLPAHRDAPAAPAPALRSRVPPRALREQGIDLYISTFNMGLPLPPRPPGVRYALLIHDLFQVTLKNYHANRLKALVYRVSDYLSIAYALRVADRVWTPSQYSADEAVRLFPGVAGKVRVLPNQVDGFAGEPADLSARGLPPRYWLLVGTRELRKNVPWFVSAWARARAQAPGVPPLVLVGSLDHLPEEQRGLPGLHALGGLDDAELHALYRQAERLWQPSYAEGFGLPVVEALSVGTPVAVASGTSLDEVTPPSAPRFSPSDGAALERLMLRLADAPREASAEELIAWAARFNREAYRQRLAALIEELS